MQDNPSPASDDVTTSGVAVATVTSQSTPLPFPGGDVAWDAVVAAEK